MSTRLFGEHFKNGQIYPRRKGYSPCKMVSLGEKLKMPKRSEKLLYDHIRGLVCKKPLHKSFKIRKMKLFWKWPKLKKNAKVIIAFGQWSVWFKIWKCQKGAKNDCTTTLELLCAKNQSKIHLIFQKWEHFQNGQNWPPRNGYSPYKMVSFGQKLKMPKRTLELFCAKKPLQKTPNIREMNETILKIVHLAKAIAHAMAIAFAKWSVWIKN